VLVVVNTVEIEVVPIFVGHAVGTDIGSVWLHLASCGQEILGAPVQVISKSERSWPMVSRDPPDSDDAGATLGHGLKVVVLHPTGPRMIDEPGAVMTLGAVFGAVCVHRTARRHMPQAEVRTPR